MLRKALTASAVLAFCLCATSAISALETQDELALRRDKKLAEPFLKNATWTTDYDAALKQAKEDGKLVFAYFTRSYSP